MKWLSVILLVLVVPGVARADDPMFVPLAGLPMLAPGAQVAHTLWPDSPCAGRGQVALIIHPPFGAGELVGGYAYLDGSCRFVLDPTLSPFDECTAAVHELGHLAGLGHSDDPGDVMYPSIGMYQPCQDAVRRATRVRLDSALQSSKTLTVAIVRDFLLVHFRYGDTMSVRQTGPSRAHIALIIWTPGTGGQYVEGNLRLAHRRILLTRVTA